MIHIPRTRKQNEQHREDRRASVLKAAVDLFARNGFAGTSTADLARAAGVSQGTVFVYFASKEELFKAALLEPLPPTLQMVEGLLTSSIPPRERVEMLARAMLHSFAREESYLRLTQYVAGLRDRFPELYAELMTFVTRCVELLAQTIIQGQAAGQFVAGNPEHRAWAFYAYIQGCGLYYPFPPENPIWEDAVHAALRLAGANSAPS